MRSDRSRRPQLPASHNEPNRLSEPNRRHAMNVQPEMPDADPNNDQRGNDAAVDRQTTAQAPIPEYRDRPEDHREGRSYRINLCEGLIDLENPIDYDLPRMGIGSSVLSHMLEDRWDNESADCRGHEHSDARQPKRDNRRERYAVGACDAFRETTRSEEQQQDAHHR